MRRIDFIGPSAVGKSTLYKAILNLRKESDFIYSQDEELMNIYINRGLNSSSLKNYLKAQLIRKNLFSGRHLKWAKSFATKEIGEEIESEINLYSGLFDIFLQGLYKIDSLSAARKCLFAKFYIGLLQRLSKITYFETGNIVMTEESVTNNNLGLISSDQYREHISADSKEWNRSTPTAVVYCMHPSLELYYQRRLKRIELRKQITYLDDGVKGEQLFKLCKDSRLSNENKAKVMREIGVPVLNVDMSFPVEENVHKVMKFLREINR